MLTSAYATGATGDDRRLTNGKLMIDP